MSNGKKVYRLFGLNVASEVPLPEALPALPGAGADVHVRLGKLPEDIRAATTEKEWFGVRERELWFRSPYAFYHVQNGSSIVIEPFAGTTETELRLFLLGSAMGFLMIQKGWYPVHGGAVVLGGRAIILTGDTGAGKSTLTSAIVERGFPFLADDVSVLILQNGNPMVLPAYPQRKLCRDAALELGYSLQELVLISAERQKYAIQKPGGWCDEPMPLGCVVEIVPGDEESPAATRVVGHESMGIFMKNLYRSFIYSYLGLRPACMKDLLNIIAATPIYRLSRPNGLAHIGEIVQLLQKLDIAQ